MFVSLSSTVKGSTYRQMRNCLMQLHVWHDMLRLLCRTSAAKRKAEQLAKQEAEDEANPAINNLMVRHCASIAPAQSCSVAVYSEDTCCCTETTANMNTGHHVQELAHGKQAVKLLTQIHMSSRRWATQGRWLGMLYELREGLCLQLWHGSSRTLAEVNLDHFKMDDASQAQSVASVLAACVSAC